MYQYLSWFRKGVAYPSGNKPLTIDAIAKLKPTLLSTGVEVHESVQRYDNLGRVLYTPLYADFDGIGSIDDVLKFCELVNLEFGIVPDIYFSGNRGCHTFINVEVRHSHPHLVAKKFMSIMSQSKCVDTQMYGSRHLLRSEGSIHFKTNLYKTRITTDELASGAYKVRAKTQRLTTPTAHESKTLSLFINGLYTLIDQELKEMDEKYKAIKSEMRGEVAPCIKALIKEGPVAGDNNNRLTLIARNMNSVGVNMEDAIAEVSSVPAWSLLGREIISVFKSTYKQTSRFGCRGNATLKQYCDQFCPFNELSINIM